MGEARKRLFWPLRRSGLRLGKIPGQATYRASNWPVRSNLDGQPGAIHDSADHSVRVVDLEISHTVGEPYSGHTAPVLAVALGELDGRTTMISGGEDATLRVWGLTKGRPIRRMLRAVCLRHSAPVLTAVAHQNQDHLRVLANCSDGTI